MSFHQSKGKGYPGFGWHPFQTICGMGTVVCLGYSHFNTEKTPILLVMLSILLAYRDLSRSAGAKQDIASCIETCHSLVPLEVGSPV